LGVAQALLKPHAMRAYVVILLAGCGLYWNDPPPPPPACAGTGFSGGSDGIDLRDPDTGQCVDYSTGDCGCLPCGVDAPNWAECNGRCETLDESSCLAEPGCHAAYLGTLSFMGCWEVEPTGPIEGECTGLDAYTCTAHDDCISVFNEHADATSASFDHCAPEPAAQVACSSLTTEDACKARPDCDPFYSGSNCTCDDHGCTCETETFEYCGGDPTACDGISCATGTECVLAIEDGWKPTCATPATAGSCSGVTQCDPAVVCPPGTVEGILGSCYSDMCIPVAECGLGMN
jgi:hypothetical protein